MASRRWQQAARELDPRLLGDPHWLVLAGALDRVALTGVDVDTTLASTTGQGPLPDRHPARTLHYRLIEVCDAATTPEHHPEHADTTTEPDRHHPDRHRDLPSAPTVTQPSALSHPRSFLTRTPGCSQGRRQADASRSRPVASCCGVGVHCRPCDDTCPS